MNHNKQETSVFNYSQICISISHIVTVAVITSVLVCNALFFLTASPYFRRHSKRGSPPNMLKSDLKSPGHLSNTPSNPTTSSSPETQASWGFSCGGFLPPHINSWEIVQLIKMIATQLLPAAGLFAVCFHSELRGQRSRRELPLCLPGCLNKWYSIPRGLFFSFFLSPFTTLPAWRN